MALLLFSLLLPFLLFASFSTPATATCYFPNRTAQLSPEYQPCGSGSPADAFTMCCANNRTNGNPNDTCEKNGMCHYVDLANGANQTWRESCTDPTWKSPNCVKFCLDGVGKVHPVPLCEPGSKIKKTQLILFFRGGDELGRPRSETDAQVTDCGDGTFCCGADQQGCCGRHQGVFLVNGTAASSLPSSTSTSASSTSPTTTTPIPAVDVKNAQSSTQPSAKVGIGVGVGVGGAVALAGLVVGIYFRRKKRKGRGDADEEEEEEAKEKHSHSTVELPEKNGEAEPAEIDGNGIAAELEAEKRMWGGEMDGSKVGSEVAGHGIRAELG